MILDNLSQIQRYKSLSSYFTKAFDFLRKVDNGWKDGRYEIDGDNVYAMVQRYTTKPADQGQFEAHRKYIDVQFLLSGRETILWAPIESLKEVTQPYDAEKDIVFFSDVPAVAPIHLAPSQFTILFPTDGHMPGREWDAPCEVTKVVVKVKAG